MSKHFGGINVIVFGDFHQLNPIGDRNLYCPQARSAQGNTVDAILGHEIFRTFTTAVELTIQCRVKDPDWQALLGRMRYGNCSRDDVQMIRTLVFKVSWNVLNSLHMTEIH